MWQRILSNLGSALLALLLAFVVWVVAVNEENPQKEDPFPNPIPIEFINQPQGIVVFGDVVESVQVVIRAPQSSWDNLRPSSFKAWVDLEGLPVGLHEMEVQVTCSDRNVHIVEIRPNKITVRLEELKEKEVDVRVNVVDSPPIGYVSRPPTVEPAKVTVRGPGLVVDQVVEVTADIYLRGAKNTVEREVKDPTPRDAQGEPLSSVTIEPAVLKVIVPIEQRAGFRDVPVRVIRKGQPAPGYWISNVSVEPSIVTVVGSPVAIAAIPGYLETAPVNVEGASSDVVERVPLVLPEGVSVLGGNQGVSVNVKVEAIEGGLTVQRTVNVQGLDLALKATASPQQVDVILSGPLPRLETLSQGDVQVVVDLVGLDPGTHKVHPTAIVPEGIKVQSIIPDTIEVEIVPVSFVPEATPGLGTPTLPITPSATLRTSPTVTLTATPTGTRGIQIAPEPASTPRR